MIDILKPYRRFMGYLFGWYWTKDVEYPAYDMSYVEVVNDLGFWMKGYYLKADNVFMHLYDTKARYSFGRVVKWRYAK